MAGNFPAIVARLANDPIMRDAFSSAFHDGEISSGSIREALAAYVSSIVSPVTRFDRWIAGDRQAMTQAEYNGFRLFAGKAGCVACHAGWRFTDDRFHDIGLASPDLGRGGLDEVARRRSRDPQVREIAPGEPAFRTPGLRQLARTAPYMHDGSKATLDDVMAHYAGGLRRRQSLSPPLKRPIDLTHEERDLIVAFLLSLSSD